MDSKKSLANLLNVKYSEIKPIIDKLKCGKKVIISNYTITSMGLKVICKKELHFLKVELDDKFIAQVGV